MEFREEGLEFEEPELGREEPAARRDVFEEVAVRDEDLGRGGKLRLSFDSAG